MRKNAAIFAVLLCFAVLAVLYAALMPPWEAPDEPAHYAYAAQLAARGRPPQDSGVRQRDSFCRDHAFVISNYEWYQPALGYVPAALSVALWTRLAPASVGANSGSSLLVDVPPLNPDFCARPANLPLFEHADAHPLDVWAGSWGLLVARLASGVAALLVVWAAYRIGRLLDPRHEALGLTMAGWVAFLPQFTFISASVRSDTLANALAALIFWIAARAQLSPRGRRDALALGLLLGLGLVTKYTFLYMLPVVALALLLAPSRRLGARLKWLALALGLALVLVGVYLLAFDEARAAWRYTQSTALKILPEALTWDYLRKIPEPLLIDLFYARFGWANVTTPVVWSRAIFGLWCLGAILSAVYTWRLSRGVSPALRVMWVLWAGFLFALVGVVRFNLSVFQPQGRLLFPALTAWTAIGLWGWSRVLPARLKTVASAAAVGLMLIFNLYALFAGLAAAYY